MRLDELFRNLGELAGTIGAQIKHGAMPGVPLGELDLTGPAPCELSLTGPGRVVVSQGELFRIDVQQSAAAEAVRFQLDETRLGVVGGDRDAVVKVTLPALKGVAVAGSGRITVDTLEPGADVSIAGSGRVELAEIAGGTLAVSIAGSGRLYADGRVDALELSIAGSGSCDAEGLTVGKAAVHIAGSGDAIFTCNGHVSASLMGSGNVIVRGSARCTVHGVGSGTVMCERERESAD
ncbi:MAG: hypothetical protein B7Z08_03650 [Sphingomonadales bacterium 32-68-7]|nr:MAG: hypothetical protein B7Z33_02080 [Sphingomonadales bacterium 12-68-11]OYX09756.1 MAG: hypothetical protein B7Z08_03650 [Sphingomonadales bacterium 32-68-7]